MANDWTALVCVALVLCLWLRRVVVRVDTPHLASKLLLLMRCCCVGRGPSAPSGHQTLHSPAPHSHPYRACFPPYNHTQTHFPSHQSTMFKITITCAFLMALASVHAFLPMPCRMPTNMKVGQSSSTGRSKSIGIINSMRENIEGEANPTQVCLVFVRELVVEREGRGGRGRQAVRKS